uniref:DDB1- and CUL4-associated factor 15 WD40 repeat-containing domain-containing protein n=1 Tax=Mola mola TaxID=94237 RepID=A0A3Q3XB37_MOLML
MAPSSKSEKDDSKQKAHRKHKDHVVKLLMHGKLSGQFSQRLFRKLPPRVCVPLKNIVSEEFLRAGHIFLGFTKCGRYVLSYTSDFGEVDYFSFYTYHLYWWEFNLHSRLKQVHHVRLFAGEEIYSDLYLTVCEWPNDHSKIVIFGFNTRSSSSVLMNLMMSDENNRDIYITITSMPPPKSCSNCCPIPSSSTIRTGKNTHCVTLGMKDQVILLNTSYSLVACGISLCEQGQSSQLLYTKRAALSSQVSAASSSTPSACSSLLPQESAESHLPPSRAAPIPSSPSQSQAAMRAREFVADLFRRAQKDDDSTERRREDRRTSFPQASTSSGSPGLPRCSEQVMSPASSSSSPSSPPNPSSSQEGGSSEPGYVNYSRLHYRLQQPGAAEQNTGGEERRMKSVCVEQLTLDFEYLINEVIRSDAAWAPQFCSFSDYDVVILEVCPETNTVMINIGLLLLTSSALWDLNTGVCCTVGVGDLTEVRGQTSGSVWSSYRKSCVNMVMKWLVPESSSRYINRMTNEALHKGSSLQVLADSDRCTWIVL